MVPGRTWLARMDARYERRNPPRPSACLFVAAAWLAVGLLATLQPVTRGQVVLTLLSAAGWSLIVATWVRRGLRDYRRRGRVGTR